jgi:hypothetical protein
MLLYSENGRAYLAVNSVFEETFVPAGRMRECTDRQLITYCVCGLVVK